MSKRESVKRFLAGGLLVVALTVGAVAQYPHPPDVVVTAPFFGARYVEPPPEAAAPPAGSGADSDTLKAILEELKAIRRLLADDAKGDDGGERVGAATKAGATPPALLSAGNVCFGCHGPAVANEKGAGFVMFERNEKGDGYALTKVDEGMRSRLLRKVRTDDMPRAPARKLTPEEKAAVLAAYSAAK
jgi:mono/diheme cytochrome c family protein